MKKIYYSVILSLFFRFALAQTFWIVSLCLSCPTVTFGVQRQMQKSIGRLLRCFTK